MLKHHCLLISDFNAEILARILCNDDEDQAAIDVLTAPYGQVFQSLSSNTQSQSGIVWTLPEKSIPTFARALNFNEIDADKCLNEVEIFAEAVLNFASKSPFVFVISWSLPLGHRGYGMLDWKPDLGLSNLLARMNLHLADRLSAADNIFVLDASRWHASAASFVSPKMWYAAKVPYSNELFMKAASDLRASICALKGRSRKLIILDLDNTLWGGVVGELGWQGIRLGGHDLNGEAFVEFQNELKSLSRRGIQLAIVSKNDESVALEALDLHTEMQLRRDDFSGWRINWADKAKNISELLNELNLGLDSVVFVDDNPAERERVRGAFPQVLVPEWPSDPTLFVSALRALNCFDSPSFSKEDRNRTKMYAAERERRAIVDKVSSKDEWMKRLGTKLIFTKVDKTNIARVTQLFNKTNQLNLSTRRLSEIEILEWLSGCGKSMLAISANDCFGDMGLIGVISYQIEGKHALLVDFILSCRVMGRKIEEAMIYVVLNELTQLGVITLAAVYVPTARNRPTVDVFKEMSPEEKPKNTFNFNCQKIFLKPKNVAIEILEAT